MNTSEEDDNPLAAAPESASNPFDTEGENSSSPLEAEEEIKQEEESSLNPFEDVTESTTEKFSCVSLDAEPIGSPAVDTDTAASEDVIINENNITVQENWANAWNDAQTKMHMASINIGTINVSSPEVVSGMMSIRHVVYNVKTEPLGYTVRRRYNDFDWLREVLALRYQGLFIPSSPSTGLTSITSSKVDPEGHFVRNRMIQLQIFMQALIKIPFVRTDPSFLSFISTQDEKEFKQLTEMKKEQMIFDNFTDDNTGLDIWNTIINSQTIDTDADRPITDFKRQLELLRLQLNRVDKVCRNAGKKAMEYSLAMMEVNNEIGKWQALEKDLVDPTRNEYINTFAEDMMTHLSGLVTGISHWTTSTTLLPKVIAGVLMSSVQFQRAQIDAFAAHLKNREDLVMSLFKAEKERLKLLDEKQKAAAAPVKKSFFTRGEDDLEESLRKKTEQCTKLQLQLSKITKGLIYCEIERFNKERSESIAKLLAVLGATNIQMSQTATVKWNQVVTEKDLNKVNGEKDEFLNLFTRVEEEEFN